MLLTSGREAPAPAAAAQDTKALKEIKNFNKGSNIELRSFKLNVIK